MSLCRVTLHLLVATLMPSYISLSLKGGRSSFTETFKVILSKNLFRDLYLLLLFLLLTSRSLSIKIISGPHFIHYPLDAFACSCRDSYTHLASPRFCLQLGRILNVLLMVGRNSAHIIAPTKVELFKSQTW